MFCLQEQRSGERSSVSWPISIWHPKAAKFFNGKSVDVSNCGAMVKLPMKTPICEGQDIEVNFPRSIAMARQKGQFARIKSARVVRIDRSESLVSTNVNVALQFLQNTVEL